MLLTQPKSQPGRKDSHGIKKLIYPGEHRIQLAGSMLNVILGKRDLLLCARPFLSLLGAKGRANPWGGLSAATHTDTDTHELGYAT